ncbi:hypothetical protein BsWGS_01100 [Bradybaena similaris]
MTHFLSVRSGKKAVFLGLTLSVYTFALMYVFRAVEHSHHKLVPSDSLKMLSSSLLVSKHSRRSMTKSPVTKTSVVSARDARYNEDTPIVQPVIQNSEKMETPSKKLNVEPAKIISVNNLPPVISPINLSKKSQQIISVKLNVRHIPRHNSVFFQKTKAPRDSSSYFRPRLYGPVLQLLLDTIAMFDLVMTRSGLDYMLYGGSLIGSYRHHGLVPWDDDVDVLVPHSTKNAVYQALSSLSPKYVLNTERNFSCWKLFSVTGDEIRDYNWKWPFLDIFFYAENKSHIWDAAPMYMQNYVFPKNIVFPLKRRPFMGLHLKTPYNTRAVLDTNYDVTLCKSGTWIHKWERFGTETSVHCSVLYSRFPFVFRTFQNGGCNESLIHNDAVVGYYFEEDTPCVT